ncbi:hypothetical protein L1987_42949 [Smallanthus sonchifolius]|uniref:Uncharacterized protein n=1 Tax=Smallanthus sonchifolius TaxID=185202 RepID=A0ACB9GKY8_9ASTR|nr:hypothetical protein L1987_42949 [Smallanthus sonchifolius]
MLDNDPDEEKQDEPYRILDTPKVPEVKEWIMRDTYDRNLERDDDRSSMAINYHKEKETENTILMASVTQGHQKARGVRVIPIRHRYKWRELVLRQKFPQISLHIYL